jgi:hypothetical protein
VNLLRSIDRKEMMPFLIVLRQYETICDLMNSNSKDIIDVGKNFLCVLEMYLTPEISNAWFIPPHGCFFVFFGETIDLNPGKPCKPYYSLHIPSASIIK